MAHSTVVLLGDLGALLVVARVCPSGLSSISSGSPVRFRVAVRRGWVRSVMSHSSVLGPEESRLVVASICPSGLNSTLSTGSVYVMVALRGVFVRVEYK